MVEACDMGIEKDMDKATRITNIIRWGFISIVALWIFIHSSYLILVIYLLISLMYEIDTIRHQRLDKKIELITKALEVLGKGVYGH